MESVWDMFTILLLGTHFLTVVLFNVFECFECFWTIYDQQIDHCGLGSAMYLDNVFLHKTMPLQSMPVATQRPAAVAVSA